MDKLTERIKVFQEKIFTQQFKIHHCWFRLRIIENKIQQLKLGGNK